MDKGKVNRVVEQIMRSGFCMSTREFFGVTMEKILKKYDIDEQLTVDEYIELIRQLIDICAQFDFKEMGYAIYDEDDLRYK